MAYQLLPFRFERFNDNQYLLTNEVGEYVFLSNDDFMPLLMASWTNIAHCSMTLLPNK